MAEATEAQILITSEGGEEAANQIGTATNAINSLGAANVQLKNQFQERVQHLGLMLFAGDALRASGLGMEARGVIVLLNSALTEGAAAAGLSGNAVMLLVMGLATLSAILVKVAENHKSEIDALEKQAKANDDLLKSHEEIIQSLQQYQEAGGKLTDQQKKLLEAEQAVVADIKTNQVETYLKLLGEINKQIAANIQHAQTMHVVHEATAEVATAFKEYVGWLEKAGEFVLHLIPFYDQMAAGVNKLTAAFHQHVSAVRLSADETQKLKEANDVLEAKFQEIDDKVRHVGQTTQEFYKNAAQQAQESTARQEAYWKSMADREDALWSSVEKQTEATNTKLQKSVDVVTMQIGKSFSDTFAQVIAQGGDMSDALTQAAQRMAEQFIESTIEMIIYWTALRAIMSVLPGGAAAFQGMAQAAYPGISSVMFNTAGATFAGGKQFGFEGMVDQPTMFLAGESGPENVSISPLSGGGTSSAAAGSGGVTIGSVNVSVAVHGVSDPRAIADEVGLEIVKAIKGRGQLNFTGPSIF